MTEPTSLYRAFDAGGNLLYVGIAKNWARRWEQHSERSPFFALVARLEIETHPTRDAALSAERAAIRAERPAHNVAGTPGWNPWRRRNRQLTWRALVGLEPRLGALAADASVVTVTGERFCANKRWYGHGGFKGRLEGLVGWERHRDEVPEPEGGTLLANGWRMYSVAQLKELVDPLDEFQAAAKAKGDPPVLYSMEAYDVAYEYVYRLLPDCVGCGCV